jgi:hypothetical protein
VALSLRLVIWAETSGYTRFQAAIARLTILGFFNLQYSIYLPSILSTEP